MTNKDIENRLEKLEAIVRARPTPGAYLSMENGKVRVWINNKCVESRLYSTVFDAGQHAQELVNTLDNLSGDIMVDNICDLCPDSEELKVLVNKVLGPEWEEHLKTWITPRQIKELGGQPFNIALSGLERVIWVNFDNCGFYMRFKNDEITDEDNRMFRALFMVYYDIKPGDTEEQFSDYAQLFQQVVTLPDKQPKMNYEDVIL